ncbi:Prolyl oligopeptidase family protein [Arthrobacter sp. 9AX]|uniref:alpha/beta hydrolase family protein n=1 Tax=Arthrobacter sp. 9AX TaxID=2653131 RepID=UPI0012F1E9E1|nr:alpha/beta fold hydrolase [Arthrobacter sp. 9AX]VXC24765.1 Prolyl oligopeptidase family protein [Arthrobacter sp. 9AX]
MFEPFPGNYVWNLSTNIALNTGAQLNEVLDAIRPVIERASEGDDATEAYLEAYERLGDRIAELADEDLLAGNALSASDKYERAAVYYLTGERMQRIGYAPRERVYDKMLSSFDAFLAHTDAPAERVEIPFGDTAFPGIFYRSPLAGDRSPVIVHVNGLDSTKEMIYGAPLRNELARRGISMLMVDHPGTGEALRLRGLTAQVESEAWGGACVDYLESRRDVDPERIGIVGWSLGGYYAPRAAAFEKRFKLCACWGANYNWGELQRRRAEREGENPVPHYWEHVQWVWGKGSFEDFMKFAPAVTLEGVVSEITVPFLVTHGSGDRQIPLEYAYAQYEGAVKSPDRELKILTEREGGIEHVGGDNMLAASSIIADWVAARL